MNSGKMGTTHILQMVDLGMSVGTVVLRTCPLSVVILHGFWSKISSTVRSTEVTATYGNSNPCIHYMEVSAIWSVH